MSQESISSSQEDELLGSPTSQELEQEIFETQAAHQKLLDFSERTDNLILPEADYSTSDIPDMAQQQQPQKYPWSSEEINILNQNIIFHQRMVETITCAVSSGPVNLPKAPKRKAQDLFKEKLGKKRKQTTMTPAELHAFLKSRKVDLTKKISRAKFYFEPKNVEDAIEQLKEAYKHLGRHNAEGMMFNITFGDFLNKVRDWFLFEKEKGLINITWDTWLTSLIDISVSHARKLRQLSNLLKGFQGFYNINVSINDILSKQELIKKMLTIEEYATFWKRLDHIPIEAFAESQ